MKHYLSAGVIAAVFEASSSLAAFVLLHEACGISRIATLLPRLPVRTSADERPMERKHG